MEGWFTIRRIHPWLYSIKDRMQVFCYLVVGDKQAVLFDTAYGLGDLPAAVRSVTALPLTVVASHGHVDHACGNFQFDTVLLHPDDFALCREHTGPMWRGRSLEAAGKAGIELAGVDKEAYLAAGPGNLVPLEEGFTCDLGGLTARAVEMPGHTRGSLGLFIPEEKTLLAGDAANRAVFMFLPESTKLKPYGYMLERVYELDFIEHYVGHADTPFTRKDFGLYIKGARNATLANSARVPVPGFEEYETYLHLAAGSLGSPDFCGVVFSPDKL